MKRLSFLILLLIATAGTAQGQIFSNQILGTNPNASNPFTDGQVVAANLTVSGIGRGAGINGTNANNRYNANSWDTPSLDETAYFEFVLTPNEGYAIDFTNFIYTGQASGTGATSFAFRSSVDGFTSNVGSPTATGVTIDLSGESFQGISSAITFRIYGWGASGSGGTFSLNTFEFNGAIVEAVSAVEPTVLTGTAGSITPSGATITGSDVTADGGGAITERGVVFASTTAPTIAGGKVVVSGTTGSFNADITGLSSETQYFVRAFATNSAGTSYGGEIDFTTTAATGLIEASVASLSAFSSTYGTESASQNFSVTGEDLTGDITVTAPTGFQVSLTEGSGYAASVILSPTAGDLASTAVYVRIPASATPATLSGDVVLSGGGAEAVNVTIPSSTVSAKDLTIEDAAVASKEYNNSVDALITGTLTGIINDDVVSFTGTGTFDTADAGEDKAVTSTSSLTGEDAGNYSLTQPVGLTGTITKADQTITFGAIATQSLSTGSMELSASSNSGLTVSYESSNTAVATVSGSTVTFVGTGTTTITASQAGDGNYNAATSVERELVIESRVILARFTFETSVPTTAGPHAAEEGTGEASGFHVSGATVYSNPAGNGSTESFSSNNWAIGDYYQVTTDTRNYGSISIQWDQTRSSTGPATFKLQYSTNGTDFTDFATDLEVTQSWVTFNQDLSAVSALNNLETAYLRIVATSAPTQTGGTNRIDNVSIAASSYAATLTGTAGWRMLSSPVSGTTLSDLFGSIWTQGFTGASTSAGSSNIFFKQGGPSTGGFSDFTAASNITNTIPAGHGVLVGVYADDDAGTPGVQGGFPKSLTVSGVENSGDVAVTTSAHTGGWEYFLAGNPYSNTIDWDLVTQGDDVNPIAWVLGTDGEFDSWNGDIGDLTNGLIAPFQGFLYAYDGAASGITFTEASKSSGGSFRGKEQEVMAVRLALRDGTRENSTWLQFAEDGTFGRDSKDAVKLAPMSASVFQVYTHERVSEAAMDIHYLPVITETLELPLAIKTSAAGRFTLLATDIRLPEGWNLTIRDVVTETSHIVNLDSEYVFDSAATPSGDPRFTLIVEPSKTTSVDGGPETVGRMELEQNYPNPFNPSTQIRFTLQSSDVTRLTVYDVVGREVAVLVNGVMSAGSHSVTFDASNLSSGVYVYKLEAGGHVMTKRMTLVK